MPVEYTKEQRATLFPLGSRVRAVRFAVEPGGIDDNETVPPGTEGVVTGSPDDTGTVPVRWDNGRTLGFLAKDEVVRT